MKSKTNKAFSLIELSIVILVIGILIAGVFQGVKLYDKFKLQTARTITQSSPVAGIKDLVMWLETTSVASFDNGDRIDNNTAIQNWYDINPQRPIKNNAVQLTTANQPKYFTNSINGLPTVRFTRTSSHYMDLPNGTVPYNNSSYTVFFVSQPIGNTCNCGLLGSGSYSNNSANAFRYGSGGSVQNYWFNIDIIAPGNSVKEGFSHLITFYYNKSIRRIFVNGTQKQSLASSSNNSQPTNNTIGKTRGTEYFDGDIGEIIIFDRDLKTEEQKAVESYLSKKWGIKLL